MAAACRNSLQLLLEGAFYIGCNYRERTIDSCVEAALILVLSLGLELNLPLVDLADGLADEEAGRDFLVLTTAAVANNRALADCYRDWQICRSDAVDSQNECLSDCGSGDYQCRRDCRGSFTSDLDSCANDANSCLQSTQVYPGPAYPAPVPGPYPAPIPGPYPGPATSYPGPAPGPYPGPAPGPYPGPMIPGVGSAPGPYPAPGGPGPNRGPFVTGPTAPKPNLPTGACPDAAYEFKQLRPGTPPVRIRKPNAPGYC